jgi:1-aminocyclopropane-1-carboxylate deaminase/D-cysteine desulfhydrase-like pyridoxal-dependent ACC family enzyme
MVPTLFEGMDNSVSRKAVVANVLSLQLVLYVKFVVAAAAALGGVLTMTNLYVEICDLNEEIFAQQHCGQKPPHWRKKSNQSYKEIKGP